MLHLSTKYKTQLTLQARGTSEISFEPDGKYGVVVGDPVVSNVTKLLDSVQGYPVQVSIPQPS
jgi:cutinase